jgi:hypothetical protein
VAVAPGLRVLVAHTDWDLSVGPRAQREIRLAGPRFRQPHAQRGGPDSILFITYNAVHTHHAT